jgi:hypothetical protein
MPNGKATVREMVARLDERQKAADERWATFYAAWCESKTADRMDFDSIKALLRTHEHKQYMTVTKFWVGFGAAIAAAMTNIGITLAHK